MITLRPIHDVASIGDMKAAHLRSLVAPMDGMWEVGIINSSPHWEIQVDGNQAGYYAVNDDGMMLQFYVRPAFEDRSRDLFKHVVEENSLTEAVASTIDPPYLSLCLDVQKKIVVHTYLYQLNVGASSSDATQTMPDARPPHANLIDSEWRPVEMSEMEQTVVFQQSCLGNENDLSAFLRGYSNNLIDRQELFVLCDDEEWLGLGEYRKSDSQEGVVDLGMMVSPIHRGRGLATDILVRLRARSQAAGRTAICSTTVVNVGAQKAISRAGFTSRHRILDVTF